MLRALRRAFVLSPKCDTRHAVSHRLGRLGPRGARQFLNPQIAMDSEAN